MSRSPRLPSGSTPGPSTARRTHGMARSGADFA
jgi:hypothetical protein